MSIALITAGVLAIVLFAVDGDEQSWSTFGAATGTPQQMLLPVLGIMLVTSEWGQRTALVTFTLEPHRERVAIAKTAAALLTGLAFVALAFALSALFTVLSGMFVTGGGEWDLDGMTALGIVVSQVIAVLQGVAFGMLIMNTAAAIVFYFALPTVWGILTSTVDWVADIAEWVDLNTTTIPLYDGSITAEGWAQLGVSVAIWVLLPLVLGWMRLMRREVKSA